ncbi:ActD-like protein [Pyxidicoccus parkwayensis]|uniref:ActD-like protein n=1 Tax=Pyxidicoccus parkwayensis TaxID=2813578 RepID=A0ABX7NRU9_9BACT|nr:ActD-like protein [Pyxidicoccus parkwaysis]QSQ21163.1 ActD-like protein [Pyxidicoccus parkwaysis]
MNSPTRTPDWLLERIALGELPPEELAAARARLAEEPDGLQRLAALEADSRATLERLPPARVVREVAARASRKDAPSPSRRLAPAWGLLVPALATVALFIIARPDSVEDEDTRPVRTVSGDSVEPTRIKGLPPQLLVSRQAAAGPERLTDGAPAAAGDVVQMQYVAAGRRHGVVLSVDGRGSVTLHAPEAGSPTSAELSPSGTHMLPGAYELDDAPRFERFFLVVSDEPFALEPVLAAAKTLAEGPEARTAPLLLPEGLTQVSLTLEKQR